MKKSSGFTLIELIVSIAIMAIIMGALVQLFGTSVKAEITGFNQQEMYAQARQVENELKNTLRYNYDNRYGSETLKFWANGDKEITGEDRSKAQSINKLAYTSIIYNNAKKCNQKIEVIVKWVDSSDKKQIKIEKKISDEIINDDGKKEYKNTVEQSHIFPENIENSDFAGNFPITLINNSNSTNKDIYAGMLKIALPFKYEFANNGYKTNTLETKVAFNEVEESVLFPGIIQCGSDVKIAGSTNNIIGNIYSHGIITESWQKYKENNWKGEYEGDIKTKFSNMNIFDSSVSNSIGNNKTISLNDNETKKIEANDNVTKDKLTGGNNSILYIDLKKKGKVITFNNGIYGPKSGAPLTIIICTKDEQEVTINSPINGNVRIYLNSSCKFNKNTLAQGLIMVICNGNISYGSKIEEGLLIANGDIRLLSSCTAFKGIMIAKKNVYIEAECLEYSPNILNESSYKLPDLVI